MSFAEKKGEAYLRVDCPECGGEARRETDTLDTFVDSAWYPIFYLVKGPDELPSPFLPVDTYIGGIEHANGHLIYIRLFFKALREIGYDLPAEPVTRFRYNGMVNYPVYYNPELGFRREEELEESGGKFYYQSREFTYQGFMKMSKSKGNVVQLSELTERFAPEVIKLAIISDYPLQKDYNWNWRVFTGAEKAVSKFTKVMGRWGDALYTPISSQEGLGALRQANALFEGLKLNKVVALCHTLANRGDAPSARALAVILRAVAPEVVATLGGGPVSLSSEEQDSVLQG